MNYESTLLKPELIVDKIITIHYFEYSSHFIFPGETHDFWEFLYVYKARERIHRAVADARLLANPASWSRVAASNPN